jgi:hypothetical protein
MSEMPASDLANLRVEALFASDLQPSCCYSADQVRAAVLGVILRLGARECACAVAFEFGEHPREAAARMAWARAAVRRAYGGRTSPTAA